jgi:hypothetical protein
MKQLMVFFVLMLALPAAGLCDPVREKGISMQMLPERVAKIEGLPWGFWVDYAEYLEPEIRQPVLQTPVEFISYVMKQKPEVRSNGVWVVLFNPAAYTEEENALLEKIKSACRKSDITLFVCLATEMPASCQRQ